jgi:hypothetical protein
LSSPNAHQSGLFARGKPEETVPDTLHAVAEIEWINALTLPAPVCRQDWSGLGATEHEVTRRKYQRAPGVTSLEEASGQRTPFVLPTAGDRS